MTNSLFTLFPVLQTERLVLRQLLITDDKEIFALRSDESVNKYLDRKPSKSMEDARSFIQAITENVNQHNSIYWAITLNDKLIGTISVFDFAADMSKAEIGYELLPGYQGKGFMQEAVSKVIEYLFDDIGLHSIDAYTHADNESSTVLLEKLNFKKQKPFEANDDRNVIVFKLLKN